MLKNEPSFQRYAFDPEISRSRGGGRGIGELRRLGVLDGDDLGEFGAASGFQIKNIRRQERDTPEWARTNEGIQKILLVAFPRLREDSKQRAAAARWARVIQMYFQMGWTRFEIADELNIKPGTVLTLTRSIVRTSKGLRANGSGPRAVGVPSPASLMEGVKDQVNPLLATFQGCQSLSSNLLVKETRGEDGSNSLLL